MGFIGGALRAGKKPEFDLQAQVKNPEIQKALAGLLTDFDTQRGDQNKALGDFSAKWLANQPGAEKMASQEAGAVGDYYNGNISRILASLRAQRQKAVMDAANRALQYATRNRTLANLTSEGGDSSYNRQLGIKNSSDILTQAAVDDATQARADLSQVEAAKLGLLGKRQGIIDAATGRVLYPSTLAQQFNTNNARNLAGLSQIDLHNTFYGLSKKPNFWADFFDAADTGILNVLSAYGGGGFSTPGGSANFNSAGGAGSPGYSNFGGYGNLGGYNPAAGGGAVGGWNDSGRGGAWTGGGGGGAMGSTLGMFA